MLGLALSPPVLSPWSSKLTRSELLSSTLSSGIALCVRLTSFFVRMAILYIHSYSGCPRQDRGLCRHYGTSDSAFFAADQKVRHPTTSEETKTIRGINDVP
jgi:hypothetical protein